MARIDTLTNFLTDVANAIRSKKGTTAKISPSDFDTEIESIEGGGGGGTEKYAPRHLRFSQYSGTELDYEIQNLDITNVTNMANMFQNCSNLTELDVSNWDTSNVTNMANMFQNCSNLTELDVSNWDTSNVTNTSYMFQNCSTLELTELPATLRTLSTSCFEGCSKIAIKELPPNVANLGGYCFYKSGQNVDMVIHDKVTYFDSSIFRESQLKSIDIGTGVKSISNYCFRECTQLTKVVLRATTISLGTNSLLGCNALTYLVMPNITSVPIIDNYVMGPGKSFPHLSEGGIYVPDNLVDAFTAEDSSWVTYGFGDYIKPISEYVEE